MREADDMGDPAPLQRQPEESVTAYAQRMLELVKLIDGLVNMEAGRLVDFDEAMASIQRMVAQGDDATRQRVWELQRNIDKAVDRMTDIDKLERVLAVVNELNPAGSGSQA